MKKILHKIKGFTLTELAIVIAVIAILIAVLVPTFVSLINSANESNDMVTVKNLNTILSTNEAVDGKCTTMSEALSLVEEDGYTVTKLSPLSSGDIVWDQESNRFLLVNGEEVVYSDTSVTDITSSNLSSKSSQLWYVAQSADDVAQGTYSYYIAYETSSVEAKYGVDVGGYTNVNVKISSSVGSSQTDSSSKYAAASKKLTAGSTATSIIVNTNGGTLEISNPDVTVTHYGSSTTVTLSSVTSYTTTATISTINVNAENTTVTIESTATVTSIVATVSATIDYDSSTTTVYASSGATISTSSGTTVTTSNLTTINSASDLANAAEGGAVVLGGDFTVSSALTITKDTIIYLNGHTLTNKATSAWLFNINEGCSSFTIDGTEEGSTIETDSESNSFGVVYVKTTATVTLNNGTYTGDNYISYTTNSDGKTVVDTVGAVVCVEATDDVELTLNNLEVNIDRRMVYTATLNTFTMNVTGGTYTATTSTTDGTYALFSTDIIDLDSKLTFTDVTVNSKGAGIEVCGGTADFVNCTFTNTETGEGSFSNTAVAVSFGGTANIYSGTYTGFIYCAYVYNSGGTINIYDGEFSATTVLRADTYSSASYSSVINVYDGTFTGNITISANTTLNVKGGTYTSGTITNNGTLNDNAGWQVTTTTE